MTSAKNELGVDIFDKAINQSDLEEWIMETFSDWYEGDVRLIMDHMDEMPSVTPQEPRWISVSERLPEESGMYLVTGKWKNEPYEVWICEFLYLGELKGWANDAKKPCVKAWMPLPKPYEPQEREG